MTQLTLAPLSNFDIGAIVSSAIALAAYRTRSLDGAGAFAAFAVGTATYGALGLPGAAILLAFFSHVGGALTRRARTQTRAARRRREDGASRRVASVRKRRNRRSLRAPRAVGRPALRLRLRGSVRGGDGRYVGHRDRHARARTTALDRDAASGRAGLSGGVTLPGTLAEVAGARAGRRRYIDHRARKRKRNARVRCRSRLRASWALSPIPPSAGRFSPYVFARSAVARPNANRTSAAQTRRPSAVRPGSGTMPSISPRRSWARPSDLRQVGTEHTELGFIDYCRSSPCAAACSEARP